MCIVKQMEERVEERMLDEERREQEGLEMLENLERLQMEELQVSRLHLHCHNIRGRHVSEGPVSNGRTRMILNAGS